MNELPEGWTNTTLGEICSKPQYGWTSKASSEGRTKYVRTTDISNGQINWDGVPYCELEPDDVDKFRVREDDILVSRAGSVGVSFRIRDVPCDAVFASYLIRFNSLECVLPKYVEYFLNSGDYWRAISEVSAGIAVPNVNASKLAQLEISLPPINEQRRIVAKLEKLLSRVDVAQERLATISRILKRFRQSVLAGACSGRITADWRIRNLDVEPALELLNRVDEQRKNQTNAEIKKAKAARQVFRKPNYLNYNILDCEKADDLPATWLKAPAGFLCDCIVPGRDKPKSFSGSIPWVTLPDITGIEIWDSLSGLRLSKSEIDEVSARIIPSESVVMSCIGRFGIAAITKQPIVVNQQLHAFLQSDAVVPRYLAYHIQTLTQHMQTLATSTTIAYLNKDNCNSLPINVPPMSEQQEIVRRVEALFKTADALEARYRAAKAHVDKLTQSILAKAFRGELVPQDPNDEPASILLERIRKTANVKTSRRMARPKPRRASAS